MLAPFCWTILAVSAVPQVSEVGVEGPSAVLALFCSHWYCPPKFIECLPFSQFTLSNSVYVFETLVVVGVLPTQPVEVPVEIPAGGLVPVKEVLAALSDACPTGSPVMPEAFSAYFESGMLPTMFCTGGPPKFI